MKSLVFPGRSQTRQAHIHTLRLWNQMRANADVSRRPSLTDLGLMSGIWPLGYGLWGYKKTLDEDRDLDDVLLGFSKVYHILMRILPMFYQGVLSDYLFFMYTLSK